MITLVIPDLHEPSATLIEAIEHLIDRDKPDVTVFLGDYFDSYTGGVADAERTALWLSESLMDSRRVHLIGNHDASYLWPSRTTYCPGHDPAKQRVISAILGPNAAAKFHFHTWADGRLLTHAGLAAAWVPVGEVDVFSWLSAEAAAARVAFAAGRDHWFIAVGSERGGMQRAGGILWADWREERWPIPQIFGHTSGAKVREDEFSLCLDTLGVSGQLSYAVIRNGTVLVDKMEQMI